MSPETTAQRGRVWHSIARLVEITATSRWQTVGICALAILLTLPSLGGGLWGDDYFQARHFLGWFNGSGEPWWDMFHLQTGELAKRFGGTAPWWTADELRVQFFRPLTAATHLVDYWLWPSAHWVKHLHNIVYFALLVGAVAKLYRAVERDPRVALLASMLFACSYVHSTSVGWIANRNAILAALFGVLCILAYLRWRAADGPPTMGFVAMGLLVASLLCGEIGVCTIAIVIALEFRARRDVRPRRRPWLGPVVAVSIVVGWRVGYQTMGFGASSSGAYIDPVGSPLLFAEHIPARLAWLGAFVLVPVRAVLIDGLATWGRVPLCGLLLVTGVVLALAVWRQRRRNIHWLLATGGCLIPLVASVPGDRLLTFAVIGFCPIVATFLVETLDAPNRVRCSLAAIVVACHFVLSAALLSWGSLDLSHGFRGTAQTHPGLNFASDAEMAQRSLVVLWAPGFALVHEMGGARMMAGRRAPTFTWVLGISEVEPTITREGCCSLVVRAPNGMGREAFAASYRGPQVPFEPGARVQTLAFEAEVASVDGDGFPTEVRFMFGDRLDSGRMLFIRWKDDDFVRVDATSL